MNVNLDYQKALDGIVADILNLPRLTEEAEKKAMQKVAKVLVKNVKEELPRSESGPYKHMQDDVKSTVSLKDGVCSAVIRGGKETGFKWHMLDDGTHNPDGSVHTPALHFTDKAMKKSVSEVEKILNDLEKEILR